MAARRIEKRIRQAGLLVCCGMLVQLATMAWSHPLSFVAFLLIGTPLMLAGVAWYLYSLVAVK